MSNKPYDRHHVIPRAVCKRIGIHPDFEGNVVRVKTSKHRAFHILFGAATPEEAIEIIHKEWSLSPEAEREFKRLTNVRLFRRKQK